jgi:hypothetical protein
MTAVPTPIVGVPLPVGNVEKTVILTPAISFFEKLLAELESVQNGTHPDLLKVKREQDDMMKQQFTILDNYQHYQVQLFDRQNICEVQCAEDELADFQASFPEYG